MKKLYLAEAIHLHQRLLVTTFYLLLSCLFFAPIFQGQALIFTDNLLQRAPAYLFWKQEILSGRMPLWNPYIFAGMPFLADPSNSVFSPFNLILFLFNNVLSAITAQVILLVFLASLGGYFLGRSLKLSVLSAFLVGLIFGFSGSVMEAANDVNSLAGIVFIPWILSVFLIDIFERKQFFSWKLALLLAWQLLSGHTQYGYYVLVILFLSYLYLLLSNLELNRIFIKKFFSSLLTLGLGCGLAAVQLLPTWELVKQSQRVESNIDALISTRLEFTALPRLIFPKIFGAWVEGNSWGPGSQFEQGLANVFGFVSLGALLLGSWGVFRFRKNKLIYFLIGAIILSLILSLGSQTFLYLFFQRLLPGFALFRSPYRILIIYSLVWAVLAGISLDKLFKNKTNVILPTKLIVVILAILFLINLYFSLAQPDVFSQFFIKTYQVFRHQLPQQTLSYSLPKINAISYLIIQSLTIFYISLGGLVLLVHWTKTKNIWFYFLGTILIASELFFGARGNLIFAAVKEVHPDQKVIDFLRDNLNSQRLISLGDVQPYTGIWVYFNHLITRPPFSQESVTDNEVKNWDILKQELSMLPANTNQFYNLKDAAGYVAILPKSYQQFSSSERINSIDFNSYTNSTINELGTKYIITGVPNDMLVDDQSGRFQKVLQAGKIAIYENEEAKARVSFTGRDNATPARLQVVKDEPEEIVIDAELPENGNLILRDFWYPGWQAFVDHERKPISVFQNVFRSVEVTKGSHQIKFIFTPVSFKWGVIVSSLSFVCLVIIVMKEKDI